MRAHEIPSVLPRAQHKPVAGLIQIHVSVATRAGTGTAEHLLQITKKGFHRVLYRSSGLDFLHLALSVQGLRGGSDLGRCGLACGDVRLGNADGLHVAADDDIHNEDCSIHGV